MPAANDAGSDRRPLKSRQVPLWQNTAAWLVRRGVSPNTISIGGMISGVLAGVVLALTPVCNANAGSAATRALWLLAAVSIQLRLLANLLDGMVAIEGGKQSAAGLLYNEVPDRVSDAATLIGAGYAMGGGPIGGYVAAILAITTAYIRAVGKTVTGVNDYCGPMAKPHRMATMTAACVLCAITPQSWWSSPHMHSNGIIVPVVPCYLSGCHDAMPPDGRFPRPTTISLRIGTSVSFEDVPNNREGWATVTQQCETRVKSLAASS